MDPLFRRRPQVRSRRVLLNGLLFLQGRGFGLRHLGLLAQLQLPFVGHHELLYPEVGAVEDENRTPAIHRDAIREIQLTARAAEPAPLRLEIPVSIELLDAVVARVRYVDKAVPIAGDAPGIP